MADFEKLKTAMKEIDEETVVSICKEVAASGQDADKAMAACQEGINGVGDLFETGEYYVGDLIYAGEIMTMAMEILKPVLAAQGGATGGKIVLATVEGDMHDIGKNIVRAMMEAAGFDVIDLGIDVKPEVIIDALKESGAKILGLSGVLTLAVDSMKDTIAKARAAGLTDVKIIIGGAPVSEKIGEYVGADAATVNPNVGVRICTEWAGA